VKLDFYQHVLRAIADLMLAEVAVQPDYMAEIMTFFKTIISKYFVRDTECKELADIAASIFDW
jgi:hypothetical protein